MSFSNKMVDAMTCIEQRYWEDGVIPTNEAVAVALSVTLPTVEAYWKEEKFRTALAARGVSFDNRSDKKALTMEQLMAANALMNVYDRRSVREKCKQLNISPNQLNAWMRQPAFQDHLKRRANVLLDQVEPMAHKSLVELINAGDLKAIQLFYEMKGIYSPKMQLDVNVTVVIARVVEIIARHVPDPAILGAIANEIEDLDIGSQSALKVGPPVGVPQLNI